AAVLESHPSAAGHRLEADLDLGIIDLVAGIPVQEHKASARLPDQDTPAFEALAGRLVVHLQPAAPDPRLDADAHGPVRIVPVDRAGPPPLADLLGEDRERRGRIDSHFEGDRDRHVSGGHGRSPFCVRSAWALKALSWSLQNACTWSSHCWRFSNGS